MADTANIASLEQHLAARINAAHDSVEAAAAEAVAAAIACGKLLIQAKKSCQHGTWRQWVECNTRLSVRTAQEYMYLARNARSVAHMGSLAEAYAALRAQKAQARKPSFNNQRRPPKPKSKADAVPVDLAVARIAKLPKAQVAAEVAEILYRSGVSLAAVERQLSLLEEVYA